MQWIKFMYSKSQELCTFCAFCLYFHIYSWELFSETGAVTSESTLRIRTILAKRLQGFTKNWLYNIIKTNPKRNVFIFCIASVNKIRINLVFVSFTWFVLQKPVPYIHTQHHDVIAWKYGPRYWRFVTGIHRSPVNSPYKRQLRGAMRRSLMYVRTNTWTNNVVAGDLRRHDDHATSPEWRVACVDSISVIGIHMGFVIWLAQCHLPTKF